MVSLFWKLTQNPNIRFVGEVEISYCEMNKALEYSRINKLGKLHKKFNQEI